MLNMIDPTVTTTLKLTPDTLQLMWLVPLVGMLMIFAVLSILWGVLVIFKLVFARPKKEKKTKEAPVVASAPMAEAASVAPVATSANDDAELVAILTAAIYAYESEKNPDAPIGNFRVVSYRRANGGRSWNAK